MIAAYEVSCPSSLHLVFLGYAICVSRGSATLRCQVAVPLNMVALFLTPVALHAGDSRIDPRASHDPCTIAKMVQIRFHADSSPLLSHGGEWPHPDTVAQWLDAAAIVLETETLLIRSAGSFIAALAMADFDSANHADDFSYVGQRLSPSDIHHWLEASSALLLLLTTKSNATSLARPVHLHVGALATRNIGAADHTRYT